MRTLARVSGSRSPTRPPPTNTDDASRMGIALVMPTSEPKIRLPSTAASLHKALQKPKPVPLEMSGGGKTLPLTNRWERSKNLNAALTSCLSGTALWWPRPESSRQRYWGRCRDRAWKSSSTRWFQTRGRSSWCQTAPWSPLEDAARQRLPMSAPDLDKHQTCSKGNGWSRD